MTGTKGPSIVGIQLPIDWTLFGWPESPHLNEVTLTSGDPMWAWDGNTPALAIHVFEPHSGTPVEAFTVDHLVILVPNLESTIESFSRTGLAPRLRMKVRERPAAFFRAGPVIEVIESPVRQASIYGIALTTEIPLETISFEWASRGLEVGEIKPAIQPGRRIMTIHDLDAGFAIMSSDRAL